MNNELEDNLNPLTQDVPEPTNGLAGYDTLDEIDSVNDLSEAQKNALDYEEGDIVQIEEEFYPNDDTEEEEELDITPGDIQAE